MLWNHEIRVGHKSQIFSSFSKIVYASKNSLNIASIEFWITKPKSSNSVKLELSYYAWHSCIRDSDVFSNSNLFKEGNIPITLSKGLVLFKSCRD